MGNKPLSYLSFIALILTLCLSFYLMSDNPLIHDEVDHFAQIKRFVNGDWSIDPMLTTIPGYHLFAAAFTSIMGWSTETGARFFSFSMALFSILVFYKLSSNITQDFAIPRTLQFSFFPILFPYFYLIYTDVTALFFVLLMFLLLARQRFSLAGWAALASCLVRQNNIVWAAFAVLWSYLNHYGWTTKGLPGVLRRYFIFVVTGITFVLFVFFNGGVALGDQGAHPLTSVHLTNVFFLIFLLFIFFLPLFVVYASEILNRLRQWYTWLLLTVLFVLYWFGFIVDHHYNVQYTEYFIRNALLVYFTSSTWLKIVFFLPVAIGVLGLFSFPMRKYGALIHPTSILFLLPSWLVEQRYYLVPFSLFILLREPTTSRVEYALFGWLFFLCVLIFYVVEREIIFL